MPREPESPHPGEYIRTYVLPPGMTVAAAATKLQVGRPALSNLLNGKASLSQEMAIRLEKAFGASSDELLKLQAAYDQGQARKRRDSIAVRTYAPSLRKITAVQIEAWSERQEARAEFPVLIRKLVASTGTGLTR